MLGAGGWALGAGGGPPSRERFGRLRRSSPGPVRAEAEALMKRIAILGSTGSIGQSALAVVDAHADRLSIAGLAAGENAELLAQQIGRYRPRRAAMATPAALDRLRGLGIST